MAQNKEAVVIVLDVSLSVTDNQAAEEIGTTFFDNSLKCVSLILQRKIFAESKDEIALVLCGTAGTDNPLATKHEYRNIAVVRELGPVSWSFMEMVMKIKPSRDAGSVDVIDALVVAMDHLNRTTTSSGCKSKYGGRQIYLMSDLRGNFNVDQLDLIIKGLKHSAIQLNLIGADLQQISDFDHSKVKSERRNAGAKIIHEILESTDGESFTFNEVIPALSFFKRKSVRPMPWKVNLEIGPTLSIPVCSYIKIKKEQIKSWKKSYVKNESLKLIHEQSYHKDDELQEAIDKIDTIEAFRYGRTLVPFSSEDRANMDYESSGKNFSVLGFTKRLNINRHQLIGDSVHYVVADSTSKQSNVALSALIHALHETDMVAILRKVYTAKSAPKIGVLFPRIKANYECFVYIQLPFAEDLRTYFFAPLDSNPKNKPTDEQLDAIDELINTMDLTHPQERFKPKMTLNPYVQRLYQCLLHRGLNPGAPLPEIDQELLRNFDPDPEMLEVCEPIGKKLLQLFPLEKIVTAKDRKAAASLLKNSLKTLDESPGCDVIKDESRLFSEIDMKAEVASVNRDGNEDEEDLFDSM